MLKKYNLCFVILSFLLIGTAYSVKVDSLLQDEQNTIQIFQQSSEKVVYVHRMKSVRQHGKHVPNGAGSGIIWDNKGHVVTNFHVIKGADKLAISLGSLTVPAKVIGVEPRMDIAVLEIKSPQALAQLKSFKPFPIVHKKNLAVGQKAIAIGNPYGLDHSLSKGVVSALGRKVPGIGGVRIYNMIQTDTPINPGNSGGPLLNSQGALMGMNTMIYSRSGASAGVGFAVPADDIQRIVTQIIQHGRVKLSGIGIQPVDPRTAFKLGVKKGILIARVMPNTPASQAKLRGMQKNSSGRVALGDVIVALNGRTMANYDALYNFLNEIKVGEKITISIQRGNKQMDVAMKTIDIAALGKA